MGWTFPRALAVQKIDKELDLCRLLDRKFSRVSAPKYFVHENSRTATYCNLVRPIRHKRTGLQRLSDQTDNGRRRATANSAMNSLAETPSLQSLMPVTACMPDCAILSNAFSNSLCA